MAKNQEDAVASERASHAKRLLGEISGKHTITGVRLVDPGDLDAPAVVVSLAPAEAAPVVAAVKAALKARAGK